MQPPGVSEWQRFHLPCPSLMLVVVSFFHAVWNVKMMMEALHHCKYLPLSCLARPVLADPIQGMCSGWCGNNSGLGGFPPVVH